jgi:hypothetical protein
VKNHVSRDATSCHWGDPHVLKEHRAFNFRDSWPRRNVSLDGGAYDIGMGSDG